MPYCTATVPITCRMEACRMVVLRRSVVTLRLLPRRLVVRALPRRTIPSSCCVSHFVPACPFLGILTVQATNM